MAQGIKIGLQRKGTIMGGNSCFLIVFLLDTTQYDKKI